MEDTEIRLRCLEMAVDRANKENAVSFEDRVANLTTWFYNHIVTDQVQFTACPDRIEPIAAATSKPVRRNRDKSAPDIMS